MAAQLQLSTRKGAWSHPARVGAAPYHIRAYRWSAVANARQSRTVVAQANQAGDDLLDFLQAKRKLRRWYGEGDKLPREDRPEPGEEPEEEDEGDGDAVLVTDAEGPIGEQIVLQLILARANIRIMVNDVAKAKTSYGPYVTPISVDINNAAALQKALRGCGSVVAVGKLGALPKALKPAGVRHALLLSTAGTAASDGFFGMFQGEAMSVLSEPSREAGISGAGVPFSIVRSAAIRQTPGGRASMQLSQGPATPKGAPISCEDLAAVLVESLRRPPSAGRIFQVSNTGPGQPPADEGEWSAFFSQLQELD